MCIDIICGDWVCFQVSFQYMVDKNYHLQLHTKSLSQNWKKKVQGRDVEAGKNSDGQMEWQLPGGNSYKGVTYSCYTRAQSWKEWKNLIKMVMYTRPGNIRVFMYQGRVCNFRKGIRVPASSRLAQKSKFFDKTGWKQNLSRNSCIFEREMCQNHKFTHWNPIFLKFVDYYFVNWS